MTTIQSAHNLPAECVFGSMDYGMDEEDEFVAVYKDGKLVTPLKTGSDSGETHSYMNLVSYVLICNNAT